MYDDDDDMMEKKKVYAVKYGVAVKISLEEMLM